MTGVPAAGRRKRAPCLYTWGNTVTDAPFQTVLPIEPDIATILRTRLLFSRLHDDQFSRIVRTAVRVEVDEGEMLFSQGDPAARFYLVVSGQIKLSRFSAAGTEKIIEFISPGHTFAEALMFQDRPAYPVNATALQPTVLVSIDSREFASVLKESMDTCFLIMGDLSQRLRGLIKEIDELTLRSAGCRVASYLLRQSRQNGSDLVLDTPKQVLAARLSITPETFSRILRKLSNQGIIQVDGGVVHVRDHDKLTKAADQGYGT